MSILKTPIIADYSAIKEEKVIHPGYVFSCDKWWREEERFIIYKADSSGLVKIFDEPSADLHKNVSTAVNLIGEHLHEKTIVSGAHTVIDLLDRYNVGAEVIESAEFSLELIARIQDLYGKKLEFMIQLNDLFMELDMDINTSTANKYREMALKPYIVPLGINELLKTYSAKLGRTLDLYYCAEKNLADAYKRHIKKKKKQESDTYVHKETEDGTMWCIVVDGEEIIVSRNDKPNCVAANAAMLRSIRYQVSSNRIKDNFRSYVGIFPLCSITNVLNGYKAAITTYPDLDLPTYFIFTGITCFEIPEDRRNMEVALSQQGLGRQM